MSVTMTPLSYSVESQSFAGMLAAPSNVSATLPLILVIHDWSGRNKFAEDVAKRLAMQGAMALAVDMYGDGKVGTNVAEKTALMQPLMQHRENIVTRLQAAYHAASKIAHVDGAQMAAIGFCFGGLCALDAARHDPAFKGAVSVHGILGKSQQSGLHKIPAKILALHGYDDPMVSHNDMLQFCDEMTKVEADWQLHAFGHTKHAFTNPEAHDTKLGTVYNAEAANRSWVLIESFFKELFAGV